VSLGLSVPQDGKCPTFSGMWGPSNMLNMPKSAYEKKVAGEMGRDAKLFRMWLISTSASKSKYNCA